MVETQNFEFSNHPVSFKCWFKMKNYIVQHYILGLKGYIDEWKIVKTLLLICIILV